MVDRAGPGSRLRLLVEAEAPLVLPGCYDALGARVLEQAGFDAVYMTGFGTAAGRLGRPDVGLIDGSEMIDNARRIAGAVDVPVLADADTGYGNPINVARTVAEYERAGVAGVHLEDQVAPKRCGHLDGKEVVAAADMAAKIRAAVDARSDPDFVIVARTDARAVEPLDATLARAEVYVDAGADALFVEALPDLDEVERVATHFRHVALVFNWVEGGRSPAIDLDALTELGFAIVLVPVTLLLAATTAMRRAAESVWQTGTPAAVAGDHIGFDDFNHLIGLEEIRAMEDRYRS